MIYLSLAFAPVLIILTYIYIRDKFNREPFWLLFLSVLGGMFSVIPVLIVGIVTELFAPLFQGIQLAFYHAFIQAGFVEELFKLLVVLVLVWGSRHFDERFDGIVYAVFVSMGFALVENIMYVFGGGLQVGALRMITAVPAHAIFGIAMGYYLGLAKFNPWKRSTYLVLAFIVPWLMHGFYDFVIMAGIEWLLIVFVVYLILMYIYGFRRIRELARLKVKPGEEVVQDQTTGTNIDSNSNVNEVNTEKTNNYGTQEQP
ncbi:MAG TPA: PrsW family glutamic-type intramembrane protease [Bacteroidales bacterium]|nr:PrsW family glutamic-type intramembrane protease [Bacteroidales bacterium]